jgi:hypothetical protein
VFLLAGEGAGDVQSLIFPSLRTGMGFQLIVLGVLAGLIVANRKLLEKINWSTQKIEKTHSSVFK